MEDLELTELHSLLPPRMDDDAIELPADASSLDFLQAVYRDPRQPMSRRMRAAVAALPFEHPKLAVTAVIEAGADFATRLELAVARSARVIEARAEPRPKTALPPLPIFG